MATNPFDALDTKPAGHTTDTDDADVDGEWTYNTTSKKITHQRSDNTRVVGNTMREHKQG